MTFPTAFGTEFAICLEKRFDKAVSFDKKMTTQAVRTLDFHLQKVVTQMPHYKSGDAPLFINHPPNRIGVPAVLNEIIKDEVVQIGDWIESNAEIEADGANLHRIRFIQGYDSSSDTASLTKFDFPFPPTVLRSIRFNFDIDR